MRRGADLSNYSRLPDMAAIKQSGIDFLIIGTQTGADGQCYTQQQIDAARAASIDVPAVYVFVYWDGNDVARIDDAKKYGLPVWLDCEYGSPTPGIAQLIQQYIGQLGSQCAGIYTGRWWWPADWTICSSLPLWVADYRDPGDWSSFVPFGGWTKPTIWQYADSGIPGVVADLDEMQEVNELAQINADGSCRIVEENGCMVFYVQNVPVFRIGGTTPGQLAKNFGGNFYYMRGLTDDASAWNPNNAIEYSQTPGD